MPGFLVQYSLSRIFLSCWPQHSDALAAKVVAAAGHHHKLWLFPEYCIIILFVILSSATRSWLPGPQFLLLPPSAFWGQTWVCVDPSIHSAPSLFQVSHPTFLISCLS